ESHKCNCQTNSIFAEVIEQDFLRLVNVLSVVPEALERMAEIAVQSQFHGLGSSEEPDLEERKQIAATKHRRALKNNLTLFQNGDIDAEEYYRQKDHHERQIARWQARTTNRQKMILELTTTMELVKRLQQFWEMSEGENRKLLAHSLFDEIVYDL